MTTQIVCAECERVAQADANGWQAYLADLGDDEQDEACFYCALVREP